MHDRLPTALLPLLLLVACDLTGQNTIPHTSSYFGGGSADELVAVRCGPGGLITVIGHTNSVGLATGGAFQPTLAGNRDAIVARFNPSGRQLLWCTYLGGTGQEIVFDGEVDAVTGVTTVVGITQSPSFPGAGTPSGPSDGFVAQIGPNGNTLPFSMLFGASADDRVCDVELDRQGLLTIAGGTEPSSGRLPSATNAYNGGPTDAFVARIVPTAPPVVLWSTYVGGSGTEGMPFASWQTQNLWWGNLDRMALTLDANGSPVLATDSTSAGAPTTPLCASQPALASGADVYLAALTPAGGLWHGTFFGGNGDEYPGAIATHPAGGFVIGGVTWSTNLRVTPSCLQSTNRGGAAAMGGPSDGFVCWIDPALCAAGLRYATYLGGNAGQDAVFGMVIESSGIVTVAGMTAGGNFWNTPRSLQTTLPAGRFGGMVVRLALDGMGARDLQHATFVGVDAILNSVVLDERSDAWMAGASWGTGYPVVSAWQANLYGGRNGVFTHLPLLPGGVAQQQLACATPACGAPLYGSVGGAPIPSQWFELRATNAPPGSPGALLIGVPGVCVQLFNANVSVTGFVTIAAAADAFGAARFGLTIPTSMPPGAPWGLCAQWVFVTNPACPGSGPFASSERLDF